MNKSSIRTYADVIAEKERLEALLIIQKQRLLADWESVKTELEPVNNAIGVIGKFAQSDKSNPLLNMGLKFASDIFLKNFVFAKAGWVTRLAVPFVMKNYSSHLIADNGKGLLDRIKGLGRLFTSRKNKYHEQPQQKSGQYRRAEQDSEPRGQQHQGNEDF
jgi:hypothetical protein